MIRIIVAFCSLLCITSSALAQSRIRDAEIEHYLEEMAAPIFRAADINPNGVNLYIIRNDSLNAFVSGGQNIFLHTGLLAKSKDPSMLFGVLAHEAGHIKGGHLMKLNDEMKRMTAAAALGYVLGAASIAAGAPSSVGSAIVSGSQHVAQRNALKHTRANEQAADQFALSALNRIGVTPDGLLSLMKEFKRKQDIYLHDGITPYMLTHPISDSRIEHVKNTMKTQRFSNDFMTTSRKQQHQRMVAKLIGFLDNPHQLLQETGTSTAFDNYVRAIAYHRIGKLDKAIASLNKVGRSWKKDAYYYELKGQLYFESGQLMKAKPMFKKALQLMKEQHPITQIELALTLIGLAEQRNNMQYYHDAARLLEKSLVQERDNATAWHQLAKCYGRTEQLGLSYLALAEAAILKKDKKEGNRLLKLAEEHIGKGDAQYVRVQDLSKALKKKK